MKISEIRRIVRDMLLERGLKWFKQGSFIIHYNDDTSKRHYGIVLATKGELSKVLLFTSNPRWAAKSRMLDPKEQEALNWTPNSRESYIAPCVVKTSELVSDPKGRAIDPWTLRSLEQEFG